MEMLHPIRKSIAFQQTNIQPPPPPPPRIQQARRRRSMPKPTLLQNLFNRPSQSYTAPHTTPRCSLDAQAQKNKYHSVRNDMLRLAAAEGSQSGYSIPIPSTSISPPPPAAAAHALPAPPADEDALEENEDSDELEFFTPNDSPRESCYDDEQPPAASNTGAAMGAPLAAQPTLLASTNANDIVDPQPNNLVSSTPRPRLPYARGPESASSSTHSVASMSTLDGSYAPSVSDASWPTSFSTSAPSTSTRVTTPATSDNGRARSSSSRSNSSRRKRDESRRTTYTDDDWAKDVRWLVSPLPSSPYPSDNKPSSASPSLSRSSTSASASSKRSRARPPFDLGPPSMPQMLPGAPTLVPVRAPQRRATSQSTSTSHRSMSRRRMSAVWEEDEGDEPSASPGPRRVHTDPASLSSLGRVRSLSSPQRPPQHRTRPPSSLLSGDSDSIGSYAGSSAFTSASRTVDLPVPLPVSDGGTPSGFTSLVLPRAAYVPSNRRYSLRFGSDSHVDITLSGLAQTTMSTVSITKNAASTVGGSRPRFLSLSSLSISIPGAETKIKLPGTPSHLLGTLPPPLSFTSHTPPPSKVHSHQILVQVYAVAVDGLDDRIVSEKAARNDCYGFVPGRAFVGRAVEVGFEVNNVAKSDWVIGLLDVRKCGALAEFVTIGRRRITRCPRPSPSLTLEQLALLPLCGVPAHRALHASGFDVESDVESVSGRALVLQGHDGAGALVVQALAAAGMHVTAHIPVHADAPHARVSPSSSACSGEEKDLEKHVDGTREAEDRVRQWGARGARVGDADEVVENCTDGAFDLVIDTVGGRRIWDACRRVLAASGQFTTLIGDIPPSPSPSSSSSHPSSSSHSLKSLSTNTPAAAVPSINAHFRANLRSLRRAFRARKTVGYALVSPAADVDHYGEDVRDSLSECVRRASAGVFVPYVDRRAERLVPFERAPELFGSGVLGEGRTGVVRVVD